MNKSATGIVAVLLIAATTSVAMAQGHHSRRYYDNGGYGMQSLPYNVSPNYYDYYGGSGIRGDDYNVSPASPDAGAEQERG